ncbi:pirin family protein [Vibrio sp. PP-XX7]
MFTIRHSNDRGRAYFGWLDSRHSFSFGDYFDPKHVSFSELRVINEDIVKPGTGFGTHGHRDMEIISYVLEGSIEHKDSEGNIQTIPAGEFQLMSAGRGIHHSEYNASPKENLKFLQIWIQPNRFGEEPSYYQKNFGQNIGLTTIATPTGQNDTFPLKQEASLHQLILSPGMIETYTIQEGRCAYVHLVHGSLSIDDTVMNSGDGAKIKQTAQIQLFNHSDTKATALIFDLP